MNRALPRSYGAAPASGCVAAMSCAARQAAGGAQREAVNAAYAAESAGTRMGMTACESRQTRMFVRVARGGTWTFHSRAVLSSDPVTTVAPSGENDTAQTLSP